MGKSQPRFDLNPDLIASRDSIWPLRIRFGSLWFEIWFHFRLLEIRVKVWRFGTKSHGNEPEAKFTSSSASQRSSSEYNNMGEDAVYLSQPTVHRWPVRNILEFYFVRWLSYSSSSGNEVPQHSSNFCQRRTALQCCRSNHPCSPRKTVSIYCRSALAAHVAVNTTREHQRPSVYCWLLNIKTNWNFY